MNTQEKAMKDIMDFIQSEDRCMLITGTHQYKKHLLAMVALENAYHNAKIIFRVNVMENITIPSFLGKFIYKQPKSGESVKIDHNFYYFDSFYSRGDTWRKVDNIADFAIVYPIDGIADENIKTDSIDDLFRYSNIKKIFLISWTDGARSYSTLDKYIDRTTMYDAEEEDPEYHKRVLDIDNIN